MSVTRSAYGRIISFPKQSLSRTADLPWPWLVGGTVLLAFLLHFRQESGPAQQLTSKASRVDLVGRMQLDLASASEAEKSAVLAITDQDSQTFADQARAAIAGFEKER